MALLQLVLDYVRTHPAEVRTAGIEHLQLVGVPLAIGLPIGLLAGLASARSPWVAAVLLNGFNGLRTIPSLAILFLTIPVLGLTPAAATVALVLVVLPPIAINTDAAFRSLEPRVLEVARAMGMTPWQQLWQVEFPLALPTIVAGIKTATVEAIASATLAAFIGAGGFGTFIVLGFALYDRTILLVGALPVAAMALLAEVGLSRLQRTAAGRSQRLA